MATNRTKSDPGECEHPKGSLDESGRRKLLDRFRRIEGQVRGVQRMIEEDRYCPDVLMQISAVQESLRGAAQVLLQSHLRHCVTDAIRSRDTARAEVVYGELTDLFKKYAR
ncbi:MAG: metal-sensitive transcriptional regulator [Thermoanaerobaculia bacterium]